MTYNPRVLLADAGLLIPVLRKICDCRDDLHGRVQKIGHGVGDLIGADALDLKQRVEVF